MRRKAAAAAHNKRSAWDTVRDAALEADNLPRSLAAMGFQRRLGELRRGEIRWWPPEYWRVAPWRSRYEASDSLAARGLRAGRWTAGTAALLDRWDAVERETAGGVNRALRDSPVFLMQAPADRPFRIIAIDVGMGRGAWRSPEGSVRGDCLIGLAMLMWREPRFGAAAGRLARLCGLRQVPALAAPALPFAAVASSARSPGAAGAGHQAA